MKYASLNNSHNKCHSNKYYTDRIFLEKHLFRSIIRSLRPTGRTPRFVLRLGDFYASGTQDIEEKKSPNTGKLTHAHVRPVSVWQLKLLWIAEEKLGNLVIQTIALIISNSARTVWQYDSMTVWQLKLLWIAEEKLGNLVIQTIAPIISNSARTEVSSWTLFCDHSDHKKWKPTFHKIKIIMQNDVHVSFQDKFIQGSLRYTFATGVKTLLVKWFHILLIVIVKRH